MHLNKLSSIYIRKKDEFKNMFLLGIGANLKNCIKTFENLFKLLKKHPLFFICSTSFIFKNKAFGFVEQPDFYNSTMILQTNLNLNQVFSFLFYVERKFGRNRKRAFKNSPRTLDIDLIFFNDLKIKFKHLILPHSEFKNRLSVLVPLRFQIEYNKVRK